MNYHRLLLLLDHDTDTAAVIAGLHCEAPSIERLVVVQVGRGGTMTVSDGLSATPSMPSSMPSSTTPSTMSPGPVAGPALGSASLAALCLAEAIDLVVDAARTIQSVTAVYGLRRLQPLPILFAGSAARAATVDTDDSDDRWRVRCFAIGARSRAAIRTFLRDHSDPSMCISLVGPTTPTREQLTSLLELAGTTATIADQSPRPPWHRQVSKGQRVDDDDDGDNDGDNDTDLLVCAWLPALALLGTRTTTRVLLLPPPGPRPVQIGVLDVADIADVGGRLRTRLALRASVGAPVPVPDQAIACVSGGIVVALADTNDGALTLPPLPTVHTLGLYRPGRHADVDPLAAVEQRVAILRPGSRPLLLCDAEVDDDTFRQWPHLEPLLVRLRPTRPCEGIRERLRKLSLPAHVIDARAVLDEGCALDVSEAVDPVRLARVAVRLREAGFPVVAMVHRGPVVPSAPPGVAVFQEGTVLAGADQVPSLSSSTTPFEPGVVAGNLVELELDNAIARHWLLSGIAASTRCVHLQVYLAIDDEVGAAVEAAVGDAGRRGVAVRVLVDSLHGGYGSLGTSNPLLARLAALPGVEVRAVRRIREMPSLTDLKLRDHRKIVIIDGDVALVGGRNLAHTYYTAHHETHLTPGSPWTTVPWLDAGARLQGPAVADVEQSFREAWSGAGGDDFAVHTPAAAGPTAVGVVVHRGLQDARTLEAHRALIDGARSHVVIVNGFPLMLELQHALLSALRRGVRVQILTGHLVTTHDGEPFPGSFVAGRSIVTDLVHSRLDPLVALGAEVADFAVHDVDGGGLGTIHPQVHAKVMTVDGRRCAIGSANLDITAAYWESELMLMVEDPDLVSTLEAQIATLMAGATPITRDDAAWPGLARRRAWMRHWPGVLSA
jgi:cardiolipin synthase